MKEGWERKKIKEVADVIGGSTPKTNVEEYWGGNNYWVTPAELDGSKYIEKTVRCITSNAVDKTNLTLMPSGTVLLSSRAPIGKVCITKAPMYCNQGFKNLICKELLYNEFAYYFLKHNVDYLQSLGTGATFKEISKKVVENVTIPVPPLSEQQHIVEELDLLSSIIEKKKAQLKELDNLAQSLFYEMFGDNADCSTKKIKDIAIVKIGPFGSSLHKSDYVSGGTPLINPIHMSEGKILPDENFTITNEKKKELETYLLQTNDIIFGRRGDIGRCALVTRKENGYLCGTGSLFVRFQVNINPIYCINYLSTRFVKDYLVQNAKGATMLNLNSKIIENVPMLFPSLDLQNQFASKIEAIERQKELIKQSIKEVETLFNSRMDYYFN